MHCDYVALEQIIALRKLYFHEVYYEFISSFLPTTVWSPLRETANRFGKCFMQFTYQVVLMIPFNLLVGSSLMKAEWRYASMECGGQCVMTPGTLEMPELHAES